MQAIGLNSEEKVLRCAVVVKRRSSVEVVSLFTSEVFSSTGSFDVKQLYRDFRRGLIATSLDPKELLIKHLSLPIKNKKALSKVIPFQAETLFPSPIEERFFLTLVDSSCSEESLLLFFLTTQKAVQEHLQSMKSMGILPDFVSTHAMALVRFARFVSGTVSSGLLLHVEERRSICVFMKNHLPFASYSLDYGSLYSQKLNQEIVKILLSLSQEKGEMKIPLLVSGALSFESITGEVKKYITEEISCPEQWRSYAVAIGLAIDSLSSDDFSLQFLQRNFSSSKLKRSTALKALTFIGFSWVAALFSLFFSNRVFQKEEALLHKGFEELAIFEKNHFHFSYDPKKDWKEQWTSLRKKILKEKKAFPFFLSVPKVASFLHWLETHPILSSSAIEVKEVHYELLSFPTGDNPEKPYSAKVEMRFAAQNLTEARRFHESLLKGEGFSDEKKEIFWEATSEGFVASFFLKSTTPSSHDSFPSTNS